MAERDVKEQVQHDYLIHLLRKRYYHYPDLMHPYLITFTNHPVKTKAVRDETGRDFFPDILVLNADTGKLLMVVEVETRMTVDEEESQEWREFTTLGARFSLYVPRGLGLKADMLCRI